MDLIDFKVYSYSVTQNNFLPEFLISALEDAFEGILLIDPSGKILYANKSAKNLLGFRGRIVNRDFVQLIDGVEEGDVSILRQEDFINCIEGGCTVNRKVAFKTATDVPRVFEARLHPLSLEGVKVIILYFKEFVPPYVQPEKVRELEKMAMLDYLTGIGNRIYLEHRLKEAILEKELFEVESSVVLMDLDNFKRINDEYGHTAGDKVLKAFSKYLLQSFMSHDYLGRWGGDEFVAILNWISKGDVPKVMERFYNGLMSVKVDINGKNMRISASCGVTDVRKGGAVESIIERCDKGLYASKSQGGNKFTVI